MSIFTKLKTATDFSASVIKEGFALIWPEKKSDGSVALQVKLEDGSVQEIGGGSDIDTNAMVRIYDATVEPSTGVVTITDGTPVSDLGIGDEIRTPDGVYQKIKDSTTTEGPADGSRIKVSGITSPADANGVYILTETDNVWKHEAADYWISKYSSAVTFWMISAVEDAANPDSSLFYGQAASSTVMPWDVTSWTGMSGSTGTPVLENEPTEQVITNTIDLFEYATFPEDGAKTSDITDDIATHNADTTAHPDKLPLSGGQMTGQLSINATNAVRINNGDYGVFLRKDASYFYIMVTAQGDPNGSYTEARPLRIDLATGDCYINGGATKDGYGNVIATTYAPITHPTFSGGVEILGTTPYIDFHYNNSESDYTFRIVQNSEDTLTLGGKVNVSNTLTVTSGGMSVAGNIKNTGEIQSETYNSYRLVCGDYGTFWRNDGRNLYLMLTNSGDQYGLYNDFRPLSVNFSTGQCDISGTALKAISDGNGNNIANTYQKATDLSNVGIYPGMVQLAVDVDFDDLKTQGNYWIPGGYHPNSPVGTSRACDGFLYVHAISSKVSQIFHNTNDLNLWIRFYYTSRWLDWRLITANAASVPRLSSYVDCTSALKSSAGYTCPSNGWIYADGTQLNINGGNFYTNRLPMVPVMSGDVVKCSYATIGEFYAAR